MNFDRITMYYESGLWSKGMVITAVKKGIITTEQYQEITGEPYSA